MFEEFEKGVPLKEVITEILRQGPQSISQVGKALAQRGTVLHRLAVAGYLKALADTGYLDEREIPPAKVYALKAGTPRQDVYERVAQRAREEARPPWDAATLYLQTLNELLRRPIFKAEILRAGLEVPRDAREVPSEERQTARRLLSRSALKLPFNDPAYRVQPPAQEGEALREAARGLIDGLLRDELHAVMLAMTTKQTTLGGE